MKGWWTIKEKSITLGTIRHAPHPLCKSPAAQISGETHAKEHVLSHPQGVRLFIYDHLYDLIMTFCKHVHLIANSAFAKPVFESEDRHSIRPHRPSSHCPASPNGHPKEPPYPAVYPDKAGGPVRDKLEPAEQLAAPLPLQAKEGP